MLSRCGVISFFKTPPNLTISFVNIFSRGFQQRISSELDGYFPLSYKYANYRNNDVLEIFRPITLVCAPMFHVSVCISCNNDIITAF